MEDDGRLLDQIAASLADGKPVDWDELERLPATHVVRQLLPTLRQLASTAEVHRSTVDESAVPTRTGTETAPGRSRLGGLQDAGLVAGTRWGHLLLLRKIGEGGFGEVFHAHDSWLDHPVALKLLRPEIARVDSSDRILREARRLALVQHPNVVVVHGADRHDDRLGFWMELVEGETLEALLRDGRLSPGEASHIGREVCSALAAVHRAGLVHRDVKAQNVMRSHDGGRIILMDFGAGEFIGNASERRGIRGTPVYLAPELFGGGRASVSSDVYAVGVLLYHLVTRSFPVAGSSVASLADAHRRGARRRLRDERPDLPDAFVRVVERATDPDPSRRFASAGEMYEALGPSSGSFETPLPVAEQPSTAQMVLRGALALAALVAATGVLGLLASRLFEVVLRIDAEFAAGPAQYFAVGTRAVLAFLIVWLAGAAVVAVLGSVRTLIRTRGLGSRLHVPLSSTDPTVVAGLVVLMGAAGLLALYWSFGEVYSSLSALANDPNPGSLDLSVLGTAGRDLRSAHSQGSAGLSFLLGLAAWKWFPHLERRAPEPSRVRALRRAAFGLVALIVALEVATRPFLWDLREVVTLGPQTAVVIGTSGGELLLYDPAPGERRPFRVSVREPDLRRNVASRTLFE